MPKITFPVTFDRKFEVWSIEPPHRVLLRSTGGAEPATRMDIMFRAVGEIRTRTVFPDLTVDPLRDGDPRIAGLGIHPDPHRYTFTLSSSDFPIGYVLAVAMYTSEDGLASNQPSTLDELHPELAGHLTRSDYFNDEVPVSRKSSDGSRA